MIISHISGGLGNQLFQYAAGKALAMHHNVELKLDLSHFEDKTLRKFELDNFNFIPSIATPEELAVYNNQSVMHRAAQRLLPPHLRKPFKQPGFEYYNHFFKAPANAYLKGNWQSEKFFLFIADIIRNEFQLKPQHIAHLVEKGKTLRNEQSVSVHIRRGDYLNPSTLQYHGIVPVAYYTKAIQQLRSENNSYKFYFFSDDIEWTKQNLAIDYDHEHVSDVITKNHYEDFYLMSHCRHNIIANSSFSWWCAWLNSNNDKKVIAPAKWFNEFKANTTDLIPPTWMRM